MSKEYVTEEQVEKIKNALEIMNSGALMNDYIIENIALGKIKSNDKIPYSDYVDDLGLGVKYKTYFEEKTVPNKNREYFIKKFFVINMNRLFEDVPIDTDYKDIDGYLGYKFGFKELIKSMYPMFKMIVETEVEYLDTELPFVSRTDQFLCFKQIIKFLVAIKINKLSKNICVDRYIKHLSYKPYFLKKLLNAKDDSYYLKNNDVQSIDYKLAILTLIMFKNISNTLLFEQKAIKWAGNNVFYQ